MSQFQDSCPQGNHVQALSIGIVGFHSLGHANGPEARRIVAIKCDFNSVINLVEGVGEHVIFCPQNFNVGP